MTVGKWRRRFLARRVESLRDKPRSGAPRTIEGNRQETFKLSTDPDFVAKARDVVGLYVSLPEHALVFCVDEKS